MAVKISSNQIQNIQQLEAVVTGPDDANRLFIIDGQFDAGVSAFSQGSFVTQKNSLLSWSDQSSKRNSSFGQTRQLH
jgi:hypothetical protein